jgi:hypothetical protein
MMAGDKKIKLWQNARHIMRRPLTEDEAIEARGMVNWTFWAGPVIFTIGCLIAGWLLIGADATAQAILGIFVVITIAFWFGRLRAYNKIRSDIEKGEVEVIEGAPEKVRLDRRTGICFLTIQSKKIRVPNDRYGELSDANSVRVAILPTSLVAVRIDVSRGVGL